MRCRRNSIGSVSAPWRRRIHARARRSIRAAAHAAARAWRAHGTGTAARRIRPTSAALRNRAAVARRRVGGRRRRQHRLHVLGQHAVVAVHEGPGAARRAAARCAHAATGRASKLRRWRVWQRQRLHIVEQCRRHMHCGTASLQAAAAAAACMAGGSSASRSRRSRPSSSARSAARVRIAQFDAHQEAIELRLRQRERADLVERILRGDHEERLGQRVRLRRRP